MESRTVLALLRKYWLLPVVGAVVGALAGFALVNLGSLLAGSSTAVRSRMVLGAVAGLLVGLAVVAVIYFRRRPVVTDAEVEAITDLPVVARLSPSRKPGTAHDGTFSDRLGLLATKLALASDAPLRFIVWGAVSPTEVAGSASLAREFAVTGRQSEVWMLTGGDDASAPGTLSEWTPGTMSSSAVRHRIDQALAGTESVVAVADLTNPLGLAAMTAADAGLIVVALGKTSVAALTDAVVDLKQAGATPTGVVLV